MTHDPVITEALKPCPFCGPRDELSGEWPQLFEHSSAYISEWSVRCGCCGIELGDEDREEVIRLWNARANPVVDVEGMVERVARALLRSEWCEGYEPPSWESVVAEEPEIAEAWRFSARAAIEALNSQGGL